MGPSHVQLSRGGDGMDIGRELVECPQETQNGRMLWASGRVRISMERETRLELATLSLGS